MSSIKLKNNTTNVEYDVLLNNTTAADISAATALQGSSSDAHLAITAGNPHGTTAAQVGADPTGTASTAVSTHAGLSTGDVRHLTNAQILALHGVNDVNSSAPTSHAASHIADTGGDPLHAYDVNAMSYHGFLSRPVTVGVTPDTKGPLPCSITTTTFTLYGSRSNITYYYQGTKVVVTTDKTATLASSAAGLSFIYFNAATGDILNGAFPGVDFNSNVIIATVWWNGTNLGLVNDERHGYQRNSAWHLWAHQTIGCRWQSGLDLLTLTGTGATATINLSSGELRDEDIGFVTDTSSAWLTPNSYRYWYQTGASAYTYVNTLSTVPFYRGANNRPNVINFTGYVLTEVPSASNRYVNFFVYGTPDLLAPVYIFCETMSNATVGTGGYTSVANAQAIPWPSLTGMGLSAELKPLYRVVVRADGAVQAHVAANDYRNVTNLPQSAGSSSISHDATFPALAGTGVTYGHVQVPVTSTGTYLKDDGTWGTPAGGGGSKLKIGLLPASAELVGATTEPLLVGVSGTNTKWSKLKYNDSTINSAMWMIPSVVTKDYIGASGITISLRWKGVAITGNVLWAVAMGGFTDGQVVDTALQAYRNFTVDTAKGTTEQLNEATLSFTPTAAEFTAGNTCFVAIRRVASDAADTFIGDAKLVEVGVFEV